MINRWLTTCTNCLNYLNFVYCSYYMFAILCQFDFKFHITLAGSTDLTASTKSCQKLLNFVVFLLFVTPSLHLCCNCVMCSFV
jgi:hypothetical protein